MMKIGISCGGYVNRYGFEEGLRRMKAHGYECLDYDMSDTEKGLYTVPAAEFEAAARRVGETVRAAGLEISQTHGPWRWPPRDFEEEDRKERFEKMVTSIRATALMGCENFVIHPIMPFGWNKDPDPAALWQMNLEFFTALLPHARENGVVICYENMPMTALSNSRPEAILRFAKEINDPFFRVCLDTGHCSVFGDSPAQAVRLLGREWLRVLHVHDNDGKGDRHWIPYTGVIDWDDFAAALREIGYEGVMSLECGVPGRIPAGEIRELQERSLAQMALRLAGRVV